MFNPTTLLVGSVYLATLASGTPLFPADTTPNPSSPGLLRRAANHLKRNNIDLYVGCSADQKNRINAGYKDALRLADHLSPFMQVHDELFAPGQDELVGRYFGTDLTYDSDDAIKIRSKFHSSPAKIHCLACL
jgi:hypothetical protein